VWGANDHSPEFRVAVSLASLGSNLPGRVSMDDDVRSELGATHIAGNVDEVEVDAGEAALPTTEVASVGHSSALPMAAHLAPIDESRITLRRVWTDGAPPMQVWGEGNLVANMVAVLERRLLEQGMRGLPDKPLDGASPARLSDVVAFLHPNFDDAHCARLVAGLVWAQPTRLRGGGEDRVAVPFAYAALKPILTTDAALHAAGVLPPSGRLPIPPGFIALLRRGEVDEAIRTALARARASGLRFKVRGSNPQVS
jgi:CRISPR-associated protein Csx17